MTETAETLEQRIETAIARWHEAKNKRAAFEDIRRETCRQETPRYKLREQAYIDDMLLEPDTVIDFIGIPAGHMEPLNDAARLLYRLRAEDDELMSGEIDRETVFSQLETKLDEKGKLVTTRRDHVPGESGPQLVREKPLDEKERTVKVVQAAEPKRAPPKKPYKNHPGMTMNPE